MGLFRSGKVVDVAIYPLLAPRTSQQNVVQLLARPKVDQDGHSVSPPDGVGRVDIILSFADHSMKVRDGRVQRGEEGLFVDRLAILDVLCQKPLYRDEFPPNTTSMV